MILRQWQFFVAYAAYFTAQKALKHFYYSDFCGSDPAIAQKRQANSLPRLINMRAIS